MRDERVSVLVVDDERFFREAIVDILAAEGFDCEACEDGEGALKLISNRTFAVAIVDVRLPGVDGVEVLRQLRAARHDMRVVMLSQPSDQERVLEALRSGACDYLTKPLHDEELVLAVRRAAGDHTIERDSVHLRHRVDDLATHLDDFNLDLSSAAPADRVRVLHQGAAQLAARAVGAAKASLLLLDPASGQLHVAAAVGRDLPIEEMDSVMLGNGLAGRALEDLSAIVVEDARAESLFADDLSPARYRSHSFAIAPIAIGERGLGVLCATDQSEPKPMCHEDLAVLRLVAAQVADRLCAAEQRGDPLAIETELGEAFAEDLPEALSGAFDEPLVHDAAEGTATEPAFVESGDSTAVELGEQHAEEMALDLAHEVADAARIVGDAGLHDAELARRICDAMVHEVEPASLLREVLQAVEIELGADPASIYLVDNQSGQLVLEASGARGLRTDYERLAADGGLTASVAQRGQLVASSDPESDPRFDAAVDAPTDGRAGPLLMLPLQMRGKTIGLARIHLPGGASVSARTGEVLVAVLSAAIRNVFLYRSLLESIEEVALARREARA
ncbi:MAG: response regulator [Myxococcota bacterium]|jgi:DNA-binding response OmpR family regulator/GAF domain-containing protein|nr:response regulator [Myxococcota bacterium]